MIVLLTDCEILELEGVGRVCEEHKVSEHGRYLDKRLGRNLKETTFKSGPRTRTIIC